MLSKPKHPQNIIAPAKVAIILIFSLPFLITCFSVVRPGPGVLDILYYDVKKVRLDGVGLDVGVDGFEPPTLCL